MLPDAGPSSSFPQPTLESNLPSEHPPPLHHQEPPTKRVTKLALHPVQREQLPPLAAFPLPIREQDLP